MAEPWPPTPHPTPTPTPTPPPSQVRASYDSKPYRRMLMELWGATVHASPSTVTQSGRDILDKDPDTSGSLGIAIRWGGHAGGASLAYLLMRRGGGMPAGDDQEAVFNLHHDRTCPAQPASALVHLCCSEAVEVAAQDPGAKYALGSVLNHVSGCGAQ